MAWNLEWFPGRSPTPTPDAEMQQMENAKAALAELKPDILLLEEVRDWESAEELCKAVPGLRVHVVSRFQPRPQNQVVASRFPVDSTWSDSWQAGAVTPPRGYSFAAVELPGRRLLLLYALHLKSNQGDLAINVSMREASARQLLRHTNEMLAIYGQRGACAVILGGDMNTSADDPRFAEEQTLRALTNSGFHWTHAGVPPDQRITIPARGAFADNCFDHVFTAGLGKPTASVRSYPVTSDHNPVVLDVDLTKADFRPTLDTASGLAMLEQKKATASVSPAVSAGAPGVFDASDTEAILTAVGKPGVIKGRVQRVGSTQANSIYFINFEGSSREGFTGIVRKDHHAAITAALGAELEEALAGKIVELRGKIELYKDAPQIVITSAAQIKVLK